ncbi:MAG TPA: pseudaminic acid synthase [Pyrinomonadaceae bacterium]|jgi:N-acetylneuraminate synthase|nr:pseudaminic acid synthase [Pyrinomonadaceae bacterium]
MEKVFEIGSRKIGPGYPAYVVAEMSANHGQDIDEAIEIIKAAAAAGADAIKLQTYTPDTMTIDCDNDYFRIKGTLWVDRNLYELYAEAYTPWEWHPRLRDVANELGLDCFSTPFDETSVDFLEDMNMPLHKVASFENVDLPLLRKIAQTGKPVIMSTGMATLAEIDEAVRTLREAGNQQLALLKCTSAYPAPPGEMNLSTIPHLSEAFSVPVGLSDHTLGTTVPVAAVALGACIIEKHFTLSRSKPGPDSAFSLEPAEFKSMVEAVRITEQALGRVNYGVSEEEKKSRAFRRSLFVVQDMKQGEVFGPTNVRSIRPSNGLHTRYRDEVMGRRANQAISRGTPLNWDLIGDA